MNCSSVNINEMRRNLILAYLPEKELRTICPHLEEMALPFGQVIVDPEQPLTHAFFMISGVASLIVNLADGSSVEVASVGREALVGAGGLLRLPRELHTTLIQAQGTAYRVPLGRLQKLFSDCKFLREAILRNLYVQTSQMAQTAACNRVHEVEQRLARWLLLLQDLVGGDKLVLTHEFLAIMLGTRRTTVTLAAGLLQKDGIIDYKRGKVHIRDRKKLESAACECYSNLRSFLDSIPFGNPASGNGTGKN
jgi:CRP-like cAMP-binding protein